MTDTQTTLDPTVTQPTPAGVPSVPAAVDLVISDLCDKIDDLRLTVNALQALRDDGFFKYLSKQRRNALVESLNQGVDDIKDLVKVTTQGLRKIKRERIPEQVLDTLLHSRAHG